jgi:transposase-like protein
VIPDVNETTTSRPDACRYCGHWRLHSHETVHKPVRDHHVSQVTLQRYQCADCGRTFRHYPAGVTAQGQSQRTVVLAAMLYGLGLSCSAGAAFLVAIGAPIGRMSVWRDAQTAGEALRRRRPTGSLRVLGADETVYRAWIQEVVVGFIFEADVSGDAVSFDVLSGVEVLVSDGHEAYVVVASALGLEHQLCLAHVRKAVTRQLRALRRQVADAWGMGERGWNTLSRSWT